MKNDDIFFSYIVNLNKILRTQNIDLIEVYKYVDAEKTHIKTLKDVFTKHDWG